MGATVVDQGGLIKCYNFIQPMHPVVSIDVLLQDHRLDRDSATHFATIVPGRSSVSPKGGLLGCIFILLYTAVMMPAGTRLEYFRGYSYCLEYP